MGEEKQIQATCVLFQKGLNQFGMMDTRIIQDHHHFTSWIRRHNKMKKVQKGSAV
jgi:hypothetical protein